MRNKDGVERLIETAGGLLYISYTAAPHGPNLRYVNLSIYPTTSAYAEVPVSDLLAIFRLLGTEAKRAGYSSYSVQASRHRKGRERMIEFTRKL